MKSTHFDLLAHSHNSQNRTDWQVEKSLHTGNKDTVNRILSLHGYTVKPGEIAGRSIPLLIGRRAA